MPSLRQRPEDIHQLVEQLLARAFTSTGCKPRPLSESARRAIQTYSWPGNIRELKNALERAAILCTTDQVATEDLPDRVIAHLQIPQKTSPSLTLPATEFSLEDLEKQHIRHVLTTATTLEEAATTLGINLSTLWRKRRRYGLE